MRFQRRSEYVHGLVDDVAEHAEMCACEMQRQRCCQCDGGSLFHESKDLSEYTFGSSSTSSGPALGHPLTGTTDGPCNDCSCTRGLQGGNVHRAVSERRQFFLHAVGDHELDFGNILGRRADAHDEEQGKGGARARHHCELTKLKKQEYVSLDGRGARAARLGLFHANSCSALSLEFIAKARTNLVGMPFFYAVRGGPTPGVYASWDEACKHGAQGVHGVQQKKFASRAEADAFVRNSPMPAAAPVPASAQVPRPRPAQAAAAASSSSAATSSRGAAGIVAGELACFTDGACKGNNHVALNVCPAGWGVAVVEGAEGDGASGAGRLIVELFGPVGLDPASPHFLGAEVGSNNTGELSAVCEALHWLAHVERSGRSAVICYDSEYAANQTLGQQKTNKNKALVARAQALLASARARRAVRFLHVKGTMTP